MENYIIVGFNDKAEMSIARKTKEFLELSLIHI